MKYEDLARQFKTDPSVSYWLKLAIADLEKRDAVDAAKDAERLAKLAKLRLAEMGIF